MPGITLINIGGYLDAGVCIYLCVLSFEVGLRIKWGRKK